MIYLERHEPGENLHRYYAIRIDQDLFGRWLLTRAWGRIGAASGQSISSSYQSKDDASGAFVALWSKKRKRGYLTLSETDNSPDL